MANPVHTCGWVYSPEDKFCRGCGERIFKVSRDYVEIAGEMDAIRRAASEKPNPAFASLAMMMYNILAWASGEAHTRPMDILREVEKMAERFPGGFGFPPEPPKS
jgi:predicted  nucleic acid-binding Zn-ribbon protein